MSIGQVRPFAPDQDPSQSVAVTTTSTAVQINRRSDVVRIVTDGVIYVRIDNKPGVTATASDLKLTAGTHVLTKGSNEYIALIADTTATAHIATGDGALSSAVQGSGGGGGGGDASAANQVAVIGSKAGAAATSSQLAGGVFNTTPPSLANTNQAALQLNSLGSLRVQILGSGNAGPDVTTGNADAVTGANGKLAMAGYGYLKNELGTFDQMRGNIKGIWTTQSPQAGTARHAAVTTTAANVYPANTSRSRYFFQNNGAANIWVCYDGTAVVGALNCMKVGPGQSYAGDSDTTAISMIAETGSCNVYAREW